MWPALPLALLSKLATHDSLHKSLNREIKATGTQRLPPLRSMHKSDWASWQCFKHRAAAYGYLALMLLCRGAIEPKKGRWQFLGGEVGQAD